MLPFKKHLERPVRVERISESECEYTKKRNK